MTKLSLNDIIRKSRILLDKMSSGKETIFTKEDYFMFSISKFITIKEMLVQKDSNTNTSYFDYEKHKLEYSKIKYIVDKVTSSNAKIFIKVDDSIIDMTKSHVFDNCEIKFPFNQKVFADNFTGSKNEKNEIIRVLWIFNKIRDGLVHGTNIEFDMNNSKINILNSIEDNTLGSYHLELSVSPELLNFLSIDSEEEIEENAIYDHMNRLENININKEYNKMFKVSVSKISSNKNVFNYTDNRINKDLYKLIYDSEKLIEEKRKQQKLMEIASSDIKYITDLEILKKIRELLLKFNKIQSRLNNRERIKLKSEIASVIIKYAKSSKENNKLTQLLLQELNKMFNTENNDYFCALYSHMILLFSNSVNVDTRFIKTNGILFDNTEYKNRIKKIIKKANTQVENLMNLHIDVEATRDALVNSLNEIIKIVSERNAFLMNGIRNGIMHKNCELTESGDFNIFDRSDNINKNEISFSTTCTCDVMSNFLRNIENNTFTENNFGPDDLFNELRNIVGESSNLDKFINYINLINNFLKSKSSEEESSLN